MTPPGVSGPWRAGPLLAAEAGSPEAALVFLELGALVLGLAILGRVASRYGLSPIPLYLLAGLAFGEGGLYPLDFTGEFTAIGAELGVILLLFMLGVEYTSEELSSGLRGNLPAGVLDLVANFTPGFGVGLLLGWNVTASVVLGGVTYISSSGVIAKVLADLDRLGNRETPVILSLLVIEDLVMAVYLPLLAVLLLGAGLATGLISLAVAVTAAGLALFAALRYGETVSRLLHTRSDEVLLLSVLGVVLVIAGAAQAIQVSSAVGAFLVGIALSGPVADRTRTLLTPLRDLFAAVFFVFFGLQTDPGAIPGVAALAVGLAVLTAVTKAAVGWWAARRAGIGPQGRLRAAGTLIARGEFSIIIAALGVAAGVESQLGPLAAAYVLTLAVAGPITARLAGGRPARGPG